MLAPDDNSSIADWQEVLAVSISHLSLHDLMRISVCSKAANALISSYLSSGERVLARHLLRKTLQDAGQQQLQQLRNCVEWLLLTAKTPENVLAVEDYSNIPRVPLAVCKLLVPAGVRVSYSQLVSAARNRVDGISSWIQACSTMCSVPGTPDGLDRVLKIICMHIGSPTYFCSEVQCCPVQ